MVEITRNDLYERIWSEPAVKLAKELGISGPGLAKACRKHGIPVPERGYWARLAAGKRVSKRPLPPRGLGMPTVVGFGRDRYGYSVPASELNPDESPPPSPTSVTIWNVRTISICARCSGSLRPLTRLSATVAAFTT